MMRAFEINFKNYGLVARVLDGFKMMGSVWKYFKILKLQQFWTAYDGFIM